MTTTTGKGLLARLGVRPVINAHARLTRLGGSAMPEPVWEAMREAARCYLDMAELQDRVGERIAELTRNEAAYVTSGAAAGLVLATAACIAGSDPAKIARLPHAEGFRDEVVIHRFQRNHYDNNVQTAGARLVEIGTHRGTHRWELEAALGPRTAAVLYHTGVYLGRNILPLDVVIAVAGERGVPVLVDAAGQLPPSSNLWRYTEMGAALAVFSGGKSLSAPQNTGILLGRRDLIAACKLMGSPNYAIGRPFKVGREEMLGLLAALEHYLERGEREQLERCEAWTRQLVDALSAVPGLKVSRRFPSTNTLPLPEVLVELDPSGPGRNELVRRLWEGDPRIEVGTSGDHGIVLNPDPLQEGEVEAVVVGMRAAVGG